MRLHAPATVIVIELIAKLREIVLRSKLMNNPVASVYAVALLTGIAVLPVFLVDIPAIADYPNHLARMYLLEASGTSQANPYYTVHWTLCPNLAMDFLVPLLAQFMGVAAATKTFLVLSQALIVSGSVALEIAVKRRHQLAGFAAVAVLYSVPFTLGLLNWEFGIGIALWGFTFWIILENRTVYARLLVHSIFVFCLYGAHLLAMGLYGAVLGFHFLSRMSARGLDAKNGAVTLAILVSPALVILGYVILSGTKVGSDGTQWTVASKISALLIMNGYSTTIALCNLVLILGLFYFLFRYRALSFVAEGSWIAGGLLVLFIAMPFRVAGSAYNDTRIAIAAILIVPAFLLVSSKNRIVRILPSVILSAIALINSGHAAAVWFSYRSEYAALKSSFGLLQRGAFVLVGEAAFAEPYDLTGLPLRYAPVLAVHYAGAFVPSLFSLPGMYVVHVSPKLRPLEITNTFFYDPVPSRFLEAVADGRDVPDLPSFIRCWTYDYDYLYLVGPRVRNPMPSRLVPLASSGRFVLFRIKKHENSQQSNNRPSICSKRMSAAQVKQNELWTMSRAAGITSR